MKTEGRTKEQHSIMGTLRILYNMTKSRIFPKVDI